MNAIFLFIVLTTSTLVLRSGDRIDVEGPVREQDGVVTFRSSGSLYSMPLEEIDLEASKKADQAVETTDDVEEQQSVRKLRMSPEERKRRLEELERNHAGTAGPRQRILEEPIALKTDEQESQEKREEWSWRREARTYEDAVTHAKEELALLETRVEELRSQIHAFMNLGYKPEQFTYQSTQLERVLAQIPRARLEVTRAQRELERFREDARKQGVLPGWLR
jgi:hypothetical protein